MDGVRSWAGFVADNLDGVLERSLEHLTLVAGVMAKLSELGDLQKKRLRALDPEVTRQALSFGAKVAAVTVSRAGANPPWAEEL